MTHQPKISIITICYNSASTIEKTIQSVVSQDYVNKEYLIIDGKSTDDTLRIVEKYRDQIDKVISESDKGISDAFNKGIVASSGELIVFINADDVMLEGALARVAMGYQEGYDIYSCNVIMEDKTTGFQCREIPSMKFPVMPFFCHVAHQGQFITRKLYDEIGTYDTALRWPMDLDFMMRATCHGARFFHIDTDVAVFVSGGTTNSNSILSKKKEYLYIVRKNGGNNLQAWIFYSYLVVIQLIKKTLNLFGSNTGQRLRYGKSN